MAIPALGETPIKWHLLQELYPDKNKLAKVLKDYPLQAAQHTEKSDPNSFFSE
jgi:hypothetical protein